MTKEERKEYMRIYNQNPEVKAKNLARRKEYIKNNPEKIKTYREKPETKLKEAERLKKLNKTETRKEYMKAYSKKYYDEIKKTNKLKDRYESRKEYLKQYREKNKEKIKEQSKNYNEKNKDRLNEQRKIYMRNKRLTDPLYKLKENTNSLIRKSLNRKGHKKANRTEQILGCSIEQFKLHLESQFEPWMCWDNYGDPKDGLIEPNKTWDIDHIIPLDTATCEADIVRLNHYTNLQPLCSYQNRIVKRNTYEPLHGS